MSDNKILIALLAGLAAGASLGLLFAPEKGTETRDKLTDSVATLGESINNSASQLMDSLIALFKKKGIDGFKSYVNASLDGSQADDLEHG